MVVEQQLQDTRAFFVLGRPVPLCLTVSIGKSNTAVVNVQSALHLWVPMIPIAIACANHRRVRRSGRQLVMGAEKTTMQTGCVDTTSN